MISPFRITGGALTCALFMVGFPTVSPGAPAHDAQHGNAAQRSEVRIPIGQFSLTDQSGRRFELASIKGKIILVDFAYTTCPDVCPLMTAAMRTVQTNLNATERRTVYLLTVTTDPEIDIPKVLAAYAKRYHADLTNWAFLTGDPSSLAEAWKRFGVKVVRRARGLVDHTPLTAVIDQSGAMRFAYHGAAPDPKSILRDIRSLAGKDALN
ncbi:MAG: SCO family protein [Alphaproteobacteria bacterium]